MTTPLPFIAVQPKLDHPPAALAHAQTEAMATVSGIIAQTRKALTAQKQELLTLPADPRIKQWRDCNLNEHAKILAFLGLQHALATARDRHPANAAMILSHIEKCENDLGSLEIDLRRQAIPPYKALEEARKLSREGAFCRELAGEWQNQLRFLCQADKTIREKLSLKSMLHLVRVIHKQTAVAAEEGYNFYRMSKGEKLPGDPPGLQDYQARASELERKIRHLELSGLPQLAIVIIEHHLQVALSAADNLKNFTEDFFKNLPGEIKAMDKIQQELNSLKEVPAPTVLARLEPMAAKLSSNLLELNNKAQRLKQLQFLPVIIAEVQALHNSMKNCFIPALKSQSLTPGSPLNPATIATEKTTEFFTGLRGILRAIRLFLNAASGRKAVTYGDIQQLFLNILNNCDTYYGNSEKEIAKLHSFLAAQLGELEKPFPYETLYRLGKEAINAYGTRLEKMLNNFEADTINPDGSPDQPGKIKTGRLLARLETRAASLDH